MTAREIYEAVLVEINKENDPSFTIEEFNYALNKHVLALVNEKYNFYASNQQLSDDLRVLLKSAKFNLDTTAAGSSETYNPIRAYTLTAHAAAESDIPLSLVTDVSKDDVIKFGSDTTEYEITNVQGTDYPYTITITPPLEAALPVNSQVYTKTDNVKLVTWRKEKTKDRVIPITMPASDYLHILSCRVSWVGSKINSTVDSYLKFPAKRLTFDQLNVIENNTYLRPAANRPYFQVFDNQMNGGVEKLSGDQSAYKAYQNKPTIEIHIGRPKVSMEPVSIEIDYLKLPEIITLDDMDIFTAGNDTSQSLELPDYLKNEVVRRISAFLLEKFGDPRIQTQPQLNQEIPTVPINMQQQAAAQQARNRQ